MRTYNMVRKKALVAVCLARFVFFFGLAQPVMAWVGDGYSGPVMVTTIPEGTIFRVADNAGRRIGAVLAICKSVIFPGRISTLEWLVFRTLWEA